MTTFHQEYESVTAVTLQGLIDAGTVESLQLEYKQQVGNMISFVEEICAFANTQGGDLFVGIIEEQGVAAAFQGSSNPDIDAEMLRYTQAIIGNTDPALTQVKVRPIRLDDGTNVIHFRVNKSYNGPHMVSNFKFPIRVGTQKIAAGVPELRRMFSGNRDFQKSYEAFRVTRIEKALNDYSLPSPTMILHYVPVSAFESQTEYSVVDKISEISIPVFSYTGSNPVIKFNGIFNKAREDNEGYSHLFKNGIIELGSSIIFTKDLRRENPPTELLIGLFKEKMIENLNRQIRNYSILEMREPFFVIVNLIGMRGVVTVNPLMFFRGDEAPIDEDFIQLPELFIDPSTRINSEIALKPVFRSLWNAFGYNPSNI